MQSEVTLALPTNLPVGRATPCAPPPQSPKPGAHGVTRPTIKALFRDSKREMLFRRILALALSPRRGNRQWPRRKNSPTGEPFPALEKVLPLPGGEGRGEGELEFQMNSSGLCPFLQFVKPGGTTKVEKPESLTRSLSPFPHFPLPPLLPGSPVLRHPCSALSSCSRSCWHWWRRVALR